jgi:acyl transferase domain-containing protein
MPPTWGAWWEHSGNQSIEERVGYQVSVGVLFPGQGSQHVGMGSDLFDARPDLLGTAADDILGTCAFVPPKRN